MTNTKNKPWKMRRVECDQIWSATINGVRYEICTTKDRDLTLFRWDHGKGTTVVTQGNLGYLKEAAKDDAECVQVGKLRVRKGSVKNVEKLRQVMKLLEELTDFERAIVRGSL